MFKLLHTAHGLEERLEAAFTEVGLTGARFRALHELASAAEPVSLGELAAHQSCVRSNMTQLIDRLESDGLVQRVADPADRRSVRAEITPLGRERHAAGQAALTARIHSFNQALLKNDAADLARILSVLDAGLPGDSLQKESLQKRFIAE